MSRYRVLATGPMPPQRAVQILEEGGADVTCMSGRIDEAALRAEFARGDIDAVFMHSSPPFPRAVLECARHLKVIAKRGAGVDSVDMNAATELGIAVMVAGGANAGPVAEHTLALMLTLVRDIPRHDRELKAHGTWRDQGRLDNDFADLKIGIVGYGNIGRRVATLARAFGASVLVHTRSSVPAQDDIEVESDFGRFLRAVDVVSLHCPLNESTRSLIGRDQLRCMKPGAFLVNTARGALVDQAALVEALETGRLAGAGLDTFTPEPPDPGDPLLSLPNVVCTPHVAGHTRISVAQVTQIAARNIVAYLTHGAYARSDLLNPEVLEHRRQSRRSAKSLFE